MFNQPFIFCFISSLLVVFPIAVYGEEDCACGVKQSERIVGGKPASAKEYPWMAAMAYASGNQMFCGASIINKEWVLTAAHCFEPSPNPSDYKVIVGDHDLTSTEWDSWLEVWDVIPHPDYNKPTVDNDIALVELRFSITFGEGLATVCLPFDLTVAQVTGQDLHTIGWGKLSEDGQGTLKLQELPIPMLTTEECKEYYPGDTLTDNMFCAYKSGYDTCKGDSGGPATYDQGGKHIQLGIVSWGAGCARHGKPGVYTKVTNYLDWIKENTKRTDATYCRVQGTSTSAAAQFVKIIEGSLLVKGDIVAEGSINTKDASARRIFS